jgi:hypothetical protein
MNSICVLSLVQTYGFSASAAATAPCPDGIVRVCICARVFQDSDIEGNVHERCTVGGKCAFSSLSVLVCSSWFFAWSCVSVRGFVRTFPFHFPDKCVDEIFIVFSRSVFAFLPPVSPTRLT